MSKLFEVFDRQVARQMGEDMAYLGTFQTLAEAEEYATSWKFMGDEGYYIKEYEASN